MSRQSVTAVKPNEDTASNVHPDWTAKFSSVRWILRPRIIAILAAVAVAFLERWYDAKIAFVLIVWLLGIMSLQYRGFDGERRLFNSNMLIYFAALSIAWHDDVGPASLALLILISFGIVAFSMSGLRSERQIQIIVCASAVTVVASFAAWAISPSSVVTNSGQGFRGIFAHKNWFSMTAGVGLFALIGAWAYLSPLLRRALLALFVFGLAIGGSTGAIASAVAAVFIAVIFGRYVKSQSIYLRASLLIAAAALFAGVTQIASVQGVSENLGEGASASRRLELWTETLISIRERPLLGWGFRGTWSNDSGVTGRIVERMNGFQAFSAHNGWLDITLQLGIVGLALVVLLFVRSLKTSSFELVNPDRRVRRVGISWTMIVLFVGLYSLTDSFIAGHGALLVVMLAAARPMSVAEGSERPGARDAIDIWGRP